MFSLFPRFSASFLSKITQLQPLCRTEGVSACKPALFITSYKLYYTYGFLSNVFMHFDVRSKKIYICILFFFSSKYSKIESFMV